MRYALRKQDKIASVYSESYLKDHIIKSLNNYFSVTDDYEITGQIETGETYTCNGSEIEYPVLRIMMFLMWIVCWSSLLSGNSMMY